MANVLLVDDDKNLRNAFAAVLEVEGHTVHVAANGHEALDKAATWIPQVIVSDMVMPGMSGAEFAICARAAPGLRHVPFILMSALCVEPGASVDVFLHKPFHPSHLLALIELVSHDSVASNDADGGELAAEEKLDAIVKDSSLRVLVLSAVVADRPLSRVD